MASRSIAWVKDEGLGMEFANVDLEPRRLSAVGVATGTSLTQSMRNSPAQKE
jgi:hypothetical protein